MKAFHAWGTKKSFIEKEKINRYFMEDATPSVKTRN